MNHARELWRRIETLHAVTYFAPESIAAAKAAGLRGFWMGYFGFRAAPLGAASSGAVEASFANFAPDMVRRAIPDAWTFADPDDLVERRAAAASGVLRESIDDAAGLAADVNDTLASIAHAASPLGRPLFAANRLVAEFDDPVAQLWQLCTTLREHRGDGHVAALATVGLDGCEAHRLFTAARDLPGELFRDNRGWTHDEWDDAGARLEDRGLRSSNGLTDAGRRLHGEIERLTDSLASEPIAAALDTKAAEDLIRRVTPAATAVASSGILPFPNPMGLPPLTST